MSVSAWESLGSINSGSGGASTATPSSSTLPSARAARLARSRAASRAVLHADALARMRAETHGLSRAEVLSATEGARELAEYFEHHVGGGADATADDKRREFVRRIARDGAVGNVEKCEGALVVDRDLHEGLCKLWQEGNIGRLCQGADTEAEWAARWKMEKRIIDGNFARNSNVLSELQNSLESLKGASVLMKSLWEADTSASSMSRVVCDADDGAAVDCEVGENSRMQGTCRSSSENEECRLEDPIQSAALSSHGEGSEDVVSFDAPENTGEEKPRAMQNDPKAEFDRLLDGL